MRSMSTHEQFDWPFWFYAEDCQWELYGSSDIHPYWSTLNYKLYKSSKYFTHRFTAYVKIRQGNPINFVRLLLICFSVTLYRNFNARFDFYGKGGIYTVRFQIIIPNIDRTVLNVNQYQNSLNFSELFCRPNIEISRSLRARKHKHIEHQGGILYINL